MLIKVSKNWKDLGDNKGHKPSLLRRDFLKRGLAMTSLALTPSFLLDATKAYAGLPTCPTPTAAPGAIAQIFRNGGNTRGAMFLTQQQVDSMNATMAKNYGILGASDLVKVGANYWMAKLN